MNNNVTDKDIKNIDLTTIITTAMQIPGMQVDRESFLREQFKDKAPDVISLIVENGPVLAGCTREELQRKAQNIIKECTAFSTGASFVAGLPGGFAMLATIPADVLQFYGVALRMAQQLVYIYGEEDMWCGGTPDQEKVTNQLILYCGVMLGATGAAETVRIMSSALAKQALKKLPQKALTKTFYYPVIKSILKFFGVQITKNTFAKGVSKVIPVIGAVVSGGLTLASMLPMGNHLLDTLDKAHFNYNDTDVEKDMNVIIDVCDEVEKDEIASATEEEIHNSDNEEVQPVEIKPTENEETKTESSTVKENTTTEAKPIKTIFAQIEEAKQMLDMGIINEDEFSQIKAKLIAKM